MAESAQRPGSQGAEPKRCSCGFWGTPETLGMCSRCYKDYLEKSGDLSLQLEKGDACKGEVGTRSKVENSLPSDPHLPNDRPVQKNRKRCWTCRSKLELVQQEVGKCRCDYVFCVLHRLPEQHACIYDHKESGREVDRGRMVQPKKHLGRSFHRLDSTPE